MPITEDKLALRRQAAFATPSDLGSEAVKIFCSMSMAARFLR
jgi:hypothetical protein